MLSLRGVIHNPNPPAMLLGLAGIGIAGIGALIVSPFRSRVVLHPDAIAVTSNLAPTRLVPDAQK
jgi:hypothetical protein